MAENLKTTQAINNLLKQRYSMMQGINSELTRQVALQRDMCAALECADTDTFENLRDSVRGAAEATRSAAEEADKAEASVGKMAVAARKAKVAFRKLGSGIKTALKAAAGAVVSVISMLTKFYTAYIEKMHKVIEKLEAVQKAQEEVRGKFGSLTKGPGQMVLKDAAAMGRAFSAMGVSAGYGYDATINMINKMSEYYGAMDPAQLAGFAGMTKDTRIQMGILGMAANLTGGELGQLNNTFRALGEDGLTAMRDVTLRSHRMSTVLNISAKQASKGFLEMITNVKAFGNANRQQMEDAMTKASQLGISIKDLAGISDAFFTFDKAAENVSKLSQAFGTQIDVMQMLNAASPADQLDQMREAMFRAGKSAETLSRHELALLAQSSGLSAEAARLAFSQESQYMSQEELAAKMAETDPQVQMANAMRDVAKEIKNVVITMQDLNLSGKGFFGSFMQGMSESFFMFGEGADSAAKFKKSLLKVFKIGFRVGKMLREFKFIRDIFADTDGVIEKMPGLFENIAKAICGIIVPLNAAYGHFQDFFMQDPKDAQKNFDKMLRELGKAFDSFIVTMVGGTAPGDMGGKIMKFLELAVDAILPKLFMLAGMIFSKFWEAFMKLNWKQKIIGGLGAVALAAPGLLFSIFIGSIRMMARSLWTIIRFTFMAIPWSKIGGFFRGAGSVLRGAGSWLWSAGRAALQGMWGGIRAAGSFIWGGIRTMFSRIPWARLAPLLQGPWLGAFGTAMAWVARKIPLIVMIWSAIKPVIGLLDDIKKRFMDAARAGGGFMNGIKLLGGIMSDFIGRALQWAVGVANLVTFGLFDDVLDADKFADQWDTFTYEVGDMFKSLWAATIKPAIDSWLTGVGELRNIGAAIIGGVWDGLKDQWVLISTWWKDKWQSFRDWLPGSEPEDASSPFRNLAAAGKAMMSNVLDGLNKIPGVARAKEAFASIVNIIKDPSSALSSVGEKIKCAVIFVKEAMATAQGLFTTALSSFSGTIIQAVSIMFPALGQVTLLGNTALTAFRSFSGIFREVGDMFSSTGKDSVDVDVVTDKLARAGASIAEMTQVLATVDTVKLQTKVEEILGSGVFAGSDSADKGKVQINLNVKMDADTIARAIVKTRIIPGTG